MTVKRITLSDRTVAQLPFSSDGPYKVRDTELPGFLLIVGRRRKSYTAQAEHWVHGVRKSKSVTIGHAGEISARDARGQAKLLIAQVARGEALATPAKKIAVLSVGGGVTLREAWARYLSAHMERKNRSPSTMKSYADHVERVLADWLDLPLRALGENPILVAERHDKLTEISGPSAANGAMRTLRAIYNHARKSHRDLPPENPTLAVDWNSEKRRNTAMGVEDLPIWFAQARLMRHPVRREFHLLCLLVHRLRRSTPPIPRLGIELIGEISRLQGSRSAPSGAPMARQVFREINVVTNPLAGSLFEAGAHLRRHLTSLSLRSSLLKCSLHGDQ